MSSTGAEIRAAVACVVDARCTLGESPVWSTAEQALYWVDIDAGRVHRWQPSNGAQRTWQLPCKVGSLGLREAGGLLLALKSGLHAFDPGTAALTLLAHPESIHPGNRYNDGKVSPDGRFWVGTMDEGPDRAPIGSLYRLDADHAAHRMVTGLRTPNGLAWSPDGRTLYHCDTRAATIWRCAHDPATGALGERHIFAVVDPAWGRPDGAAVDAEGCYWSCGIGAGRINRFAPDGSLLGFVKLPVTHPTMPCFGGEGLRTMYVTSGRGGLSAEVLATAPLAGGVFAIDVGVSGLEASLFAG